MLRQSRSKNQSKRKSHKLINNMSLNNHSSRLVSNINDNNSSRLNNNSSRLNKKDTLL